MKRRLAVFLIAAALFSAVNIGLLTLEHLMDPRWGARETNLQWLALAAVVALTIAGLARGESARWVVGAIVLVVAAGFVPRLYDIRLKAERQAEYKSRVRELDAGVLAEIEKRRQEIEARIVERRPYQGEEARLFVVFVTDADLSTAGGPNRSPQSIALLRRALEAKVLDPNTVVKQPVRADRGPEPLFVNFYRNVRQRPEQSLLSSDWTILKLFAANGADLTLPEAAPFAADLRKTETPLYGGLYIELK